MHKKNDLPSAVVSKVVHKRMPLSIRLFLSTIFLLGAIIYSISPIDAIPDLLGPIGWVDDIMIWVLALIIDMKLLIDRSLTKGKEMNKNLKDCDSFFSENV
jgi:uncharacterized membrane protein YkvA (DUF1232 family)